MYPIRLYSCQQASTVLYGLHHSEVLFFVTYKGTATNAVHPLHVELILFAHLII